MRYMRDNFSQLEVEMERILKVDSYDILNLEAEKIPPGSDALVSLPYFMGERTPIWDPDARRCYFWPFSLSYQRACYSVFDGVGSLCLISQF